MGWVPLTSVVDKHIQTTKFLLDPVEGLGDRFVIFDVNLHGLDLAFAGRELRLRCLGSSTCFIDVATCKQDGVSDGGLEERFDYFESETGIGTGDEDNRAGF